ncbi:MAG: ABC transporter permease [Chitinophagaceae bacterium]|nr:ABC transporter permease [Chitinophagaceae bacterium]
MNKIWLIIRREYITRVRKKSFIVTTLLIPIMMFGLFSLFVYMAIKSEQKQTIVINDESGVFINKLDTVQKSYTLVYDHLRSGEENKGILERNKADIYLHIYPFADNKPDSIHLFKEGGVSLSAKSFINDQLDNIFQAKQLQDAGIDKMQIDSIQNSVIQIKSFDLKDNKETNSEIASSIGYAMGFLIYLVIFIYGAGVMRGVMEEKTNRIAEVIISSVKPFQLMMGKIIGIALVGLTQFMMWIMLMLLLQLLLPLFIPGLTEVLHSGVNVPADMQNSMSGLSNPENMGVIKAFMNQNWGLIFASFLFYFLGGYFLYASMFAAVGSLVNEDPQEAQQLTIPVTMPIILGFMIMATSVKDPNSSLSVFGSLFPLTSPIVMLARIPYGVPAWQLILSMVLLVAGFIFMTWLSAKIYRTGILLYGKKPTWKEVFKWIRYS